MKRRILPVLLTLALCLGMLPTTVLAAEPNATAEAFEVTGGTSGTAYSYEDGVLTVNSGANITISMANGATTPTSDRIVVNGNAEITLNGVNITGSEYDDINVTNAQSAIDVSDNATLILNLSESSQNTLTGGSGGNSVGAPGIHVPASSSLVIQGSGGLSVKGGNSTNTYGGNGIGGKSGSEQTGTACGTVVILATGNVTVTGGGGLGSTSDGVDIGGGFGTQKGDDGQGIRPGTGGTYTVYGDLKLPCDIIIPQGATVNIPSGTSLEVPEGTTLTNSGTILVQGGTFTNSGTVNGNQPTYPSKVTVSFSQGGQAVTSVPYGSTVTITATMEKAATAANALSADTGKVDFYLGAVEDGTKLNESGVSVTQGSDGTCTATLEVTLEGENWKPSESTYTITVDFGGYTPSEGTSGESLAPNTGSAQLTVTKAEQTAPNGTFSTASSTENSVYVTFTDVTQSKNENGIEIAYAVGPTASEPTGNWTTATSNSSGLIYSANIQSLSPGTPYIFFARYKGNDTHKPSPAFASNFARYTNPKILTQSLPNAYVGVEYSQKLEAQAAEGVAVKWAIYNGSLPAGLTLNSDGTITGTPTTPTTQAVSIAVTATAGEGTGSAISKQDLTISVTKSDAELGGLTVSGNTGLNNAFQYGDTITVTFTPERKESTSTNALAENTATLTYTPDSGEIVTLATATAQADGSFKLTYDTKEKKLPIGEDVPLTVSYGGSGALNPTESKLNVTLEKAPLKNAPTVTGEFVFDETLTANYTKQDDETVTYQWHRGNQPIDGATSDTHTLTAKDVGQSITVAVTATDAYHTGSVTSEPVTVERPYVPPANPNYRIDLPTPENGTVTADPAAAKAGETVTLTPTPDAGYEVGEVTVTDRFGDAVEVTENADGTYTFTMPNGQVTVTVTFAETPLPFTDVMEGDWFYDAVVYAYETGLMDGVGDNLFAPNSQTTRAQLVTILYRLAGEPAVSGDAAFTDVEPGLWYTDAVLWAAQNGIVNGISETEFAPSGDLSREQLATILFRYAESAGYDVSAQADLSSFPDAGDIQAYATEALSWAVAEGLLQGFEDGSLRPQGNASRAQIAAVLMRFCEGVGA